MLRRQKPSDSLTVDCNCKDEGTVILFYIYFNNDSVQKFYDEHVELLNKLDIFGKVRIASEGLNITLGGSKSSIKQYVNYISRLIVDEDIKCIAPDLNKLYYTFCEQKLSDNQIMETLLLNKDSQQDDLFWTPLKLAFFKPTVGCKHVFDNLSIKIVDEICPLGLNTKNKELVIDWDKQKENKIQRIKLSPAEFHEMIIKENEAFILDIRNYYESMIGHFDNAILPPIRNFKSLSGYVKNMKLPKDKKYMFTYCTGGIRCEKATAMIKDEIKDSDIECIYMLEGGIHNYLQWSKNNLPKGECLFQGRNYIFDARQSSSLTSDKIELEHEAISYCLNCNKKSAFLFKCKAKYCHKLIIRCAPNNNVSKCFDEMPFCCVDCKDMDLVSTDLKRTRMCKCELDRVQKLKSIE